MNKEKELLDVHTEQEQFDFSGGLLQVISQVLVNQFAPLHRSLVLGADRAAHVRSLCCFPASDSPSAAQQLEVKPGLSSTSGPVDGVKCPGTEKEKEKRRRRERRWQKRPLSSLSFTPDDPEGFQMNRFKSKIQVDAENEQAFRLKYTLSKSFSFLFNIN